MERAGVADGLSMKRALRQLFVLYVAANMLVCALVFFPWARPRETVSGLIGRWLRTEKGWRRRFATRACIVVNRVYSWEPEHCAVTHEVEHRACAILYPVLFPAAPPLGEMPEMRDKCFPS